MLTTSVCVRAPPAQGILWSLCLFYSASSLGSAYYQRETVRVGETVLEGAAPPRLRAPPPGL